MDVYIIHRKMWSRRSALAGYSGDVWVPVASVRRAPPRSGEGFRNWFLLHVHNRPGVYFVNRTQHDGEGAGLHPVVMLKLDEDGRLEILRRHTGVRGIPGRAGRDLWFKNPARPRFQYRR